jgi:hypothetical protein
MNADVIRRFDERVNEYTTDASHAVFINSFEQGQQDLSRGRGVAHRVNYYKDLKHCVHILGIVGAFFTFIAGALGYFFQNVVLKCIGVAGAVTTLVSVMCNKFLN